MMGGIMDGIAQALTSSLHLQDGHFLEGSWDNYVLHAAVERPAATSQVIVMPPTTDRARAAPASSAWPRRWPPSPAPTRRATGKMPTQFPINHDEPLGFDAVPDRPADPAVARPTASTTPTERGASMPTHTLHPQRQAVTVDAADDVRLLWVLRDLLGVTGPKYGCGLDVCKACTCHINGKAFNPCSVPVARHQADGRDHDDRGPAGDRRQATCTRCRRPGSTIDVAQCGYCQPGQIMAAVARSSRRKAAGRAITDADLDEIRNVCRCGTYPRIREAIEAAAAQM